MAKLLARPSEGVQVMTTVADVAFQPKTSGKGILEDHNLLVVRKSLAVDLVAQLRRKPAKR